MATVLGALVVGAGSVVLGPSFTSTADVLWNPGALEYLGGATPDTPDSLDRQVSDQREVVLSDAVVSGAADELGMDPDDVRDMLEVEVQTGSSLLVVSATADDADEAVEVSEAVTAAYVEDVRVSGAGALADQADILQGSIDRLTGETATLTADLAAANGELAQLPVTSPAYGAAQNRATGLSTRLTDASAELSDLVSEQESLRASAEAYPGQAFVLRDARTPTGPSSLSLPTALVLGAALGLLLGACVVLYRTHREGAAARAAGAASSPG